MELGDDATGVRLGLRRLSGDFHRVRRGMELPDAGHPFICYDEPRCAQEFLQLRRDGADALGSENDRATGPLLGPPLI